MSEQNDNETWREITKRFDAASPWLGDTYAPQLRSLYALADILDAEGDVPPATLVAEYARLHRWLLNKNGTGKPDPEPEHTGPTLFEMMGGKFG